ncbi:hypothetical protein LIA77_10823 [Sarocladium implicatum]|nr:hypothetical protein LIA77_10823 [Sarocladium implicatum]
MEKANGLSSAANSQATSDMESSTSRNKKDPISNDVRAIELGNRAGRNNLLMIWPETNRCNRGQESSGLNTYLVVTRTIYANLPDCYWELPEMGEGEDHPWGHDKLLKSAWNGTLKDNEYESDTLTMSFKDLCLRGPAMALWTIEEMNPFRGYDWQGPESPEWKPVDHDTPDFVRLARESPHPWLYEIELVPRMDMTAAVQALFKPETVRPGYAIRKLPSMPPLVYVTAVVNLGDSGAKLNYKEFQEFRFHDETMTGSYWYRLVIMARERRDQSGDDKVRIWDRCGKQIPPENIDITQTVYARKDWVTSDLSTGDRVFLMYSRVSGPAPLLFPEIHVPRPVNPIIILAQKLIDEAMESLPDDEDECK